MTRDEARAINRELYRQEGGTGSKRAPDGRWLVTTQLRAYPDHIGQGVAADPMVATGSGSTCQPRLSR